MTSIKQQRTRAAASAVAVVPDKAMQPPPKTSPSPGYKRTRSQKKDLADELEPSTSLEAKTTAEEDQFKLKSSSPSPSLTDGHGPTTATNTKLEEPTDDMTEPLAAETGAEDQDTPMEDVEKANTSIPNENIVEKLDQTPLFDPIVFKTATTTLQETLATMNAKATTHTYISCDDLDRVYKQFDVFINNHPTLGPLIQPMTAKIMEMPPPPPPPRAADNAGAGGGAGDGASAGIGTASLSSMLSDLETNFLAAAGGSGGATADVGVAAEVAAAATIATQVQQQLLEPQATAIPQLRAGWDASSLLQLQPALASALSNRLKNNTTTTTTATTNNTTSANTHLHLPTSIDGATTMMTTTTDGSAGTTFLQEKIRKAIVAAQAGYSNTTTANTTATNIKNFSSNNTAGLAATYTPGMSSGHQQQQQQQQYNNHSSSQMQHTSLISGSQEHYYQPSAADSAAIAAATAAALTGQSRAGLDKTPALELLRALSNINYTSGEGPMMMHNTTMNAHTTDQHRTYPEGAAGIYDGGGFGGGGGGSEEYDELVDMDRSRSPTPTINPHTNRPLRRVVVQKAADELAASALVSLGAMAGPPPHALPASRGNTFNRNGIKRSAAVQQTSYDEYPYSYSDGGYGGGASRKRKSPPARGGGGGSVSAGGALPSTASAEPGGTSDPDVNAKVQLLMLMAQNLGEMQNPTTINNTNNINNIGGGGDGSGGSAAVTRAASEGAPEDKPAASI